MPSAINVQAGVIFNTLPAHRCQIRRYWVDDWELAPYLRANSFSKRAFPEIGAADLEYDYGWIEREGVDVAAYFPRLDLVHWYVRIEVDQFDAEGAPADPIVWIGVIEEQGDARDGARLDADGNRQATGKQTFVAFGLEAFLEREIVRESTIEAPTGQEALGAELTLGRPLGFNVPPARSDDATRGNRSNEQGVEGAYIFAKDIATAEEWSLREAAEYLLAYRSPKNPGGGVGLPFALDVDAALQIPDWNHPRLPVAGESLYELLGKLISRKRLVGFYCDVDEAAGKVKLYSFTFAQAPIALGANLIAANDNQVSLDFDEAFDVDEAIIKQSASQQFDQVVCRGARKGSCFTLSWKDGTLVKDWDSTIETEYETAASGEGDYPASWAEQQQRNALWRRADKYERVYAWFCVPKDWDGTVKDGENNGDSVPVFVEDDEFDQAAPFYPAELLFRPHLPLLTDHDYVDDAIANDSVQDKTPENSQPERLRPMAFLKVLSKDGETRYQHAEKPVEVDKTDKFSLAGARWHCSLRMQDRALGIELRVHGAPQHAIAKTDFTKQDSDEAPVVDYQDNLLVTVYCLSDHVLEVAHPPTDELTTADDVLRKLEIDFGEDGRLDYLPANTVVGVADGKLQRSSGGYVRDDRDRMREVAEMAYEWYRSPRQAFTLGFRQVSGAFRLGMLITQIGSGATLESVNTPITSIEWDLRRGRTVIQTGFAELDPLQFSGGLARSAIAGAGGGF